MNDTVTMYRLVQATINADGTATAQVVMKYRTAHRHQAVALANWCNKGAERTSQPHRYFVESYEV